MITTLWRLALVLAVLACLGTGLASAQTPVTTYYAGPYYVGPYYYARPYYATPAVPATVSPDGVVRTFPPGYGAAYDRGPVGYGPEDTGAWKYDYSTGTWVVSYSR
jgi:hypothetical protein